jgi:5-methylcytosine-specific restriction endonuclease McrBC regulatory subunit McrC
MLDFAIDEWKVSDNPVPAGLMDDPLFKKGLSDLRKRGIIDLVLKPDGIHIRSLNFIGLFILRSTQGNCRLLLKPKVPIKSLLEIMLYTLEGVSLRDVRDMIAEIGFEEEEIKVLDILALAMIRRFIASLTEALVWGFLVTSEDQRVISSTIEGRLLASESVSMIGSTGLPILVSISRSYTNDNIVNGLIKAVCRKLLDKRWRAFTGRKDLIALNSVLLELGYVNEIDASSIQQLDIHQILSSIPFERQYLHKLASLAYTILTYVRLGELAGIPSVYVDMSVIFERFVRKLFIDATRTHNLIVRKARREDGVYLTDKPVQIHGLEPDILIFKEQSLLAVGDAKYTLEKPEDDKESHNQVFTYMVRWGTRHAALVFPASDPSEQGTATYIIRNNNGERRLHFLKISLENMESAFISLQSFITTIADTNVGTENH